MRVCVCGKIQEENEKGIGSDCDAVLVSECCELNHFGKRERRLRGRSGDLTVANFFLRLGRMQVHGSFPQAPHSPASRRLRTLRTAMLSGF